MNGGNGPSEGESIGQPVLLIRHAATSWTGRRWCGRADPVLSAAGRRAARILAGDVAAELGARLRPLGVDRSAGPSTRASDGVRLLVSPARRARQTAAFIEAAIDVAGTVELDLVEVDVGVAEGLDWATLETEHPTVAAEIARGIQPDWPGGETRADVGRRAARMAEGIRAEAAGRTVIVVSHGAILHAIAALLVEDARPILGLEPAGILRLDPTSGVGQVVGRPDRSR